MITEIIESIDHKFMTKDDEETLQELQTLYGQIQEADTVQSLRAIRDSKWSEKTLPQTLEQAREAMLSWVRDDIRHISYTTKCACRDVWLWGSLFAQKKS